MEEGAFGIDAGDDSFDGDIPRAAEHDTGDGAVFDADVLDFGVGANFGAGLLCGFGRGRARNCRGRRAEMLQCRQDEYRKRPAVARTAVEPADQGPSAVPKCHARR